LRLSYLASHSCARQPIMLPEFMQTAVKARHPQASVESDGQCP
jgi:hypothetical protein